MWASERYNSSSLGPYTMISSRGGYSNGACHVLLCVQSHEPAGGSHLPNRPPQEGSLPQLVLLSSTACMVHGVQAKPASKGSSGAIGFLRGCLLDESMTLSVSSARH